jgi:hypothetical protein
MQMLALSPQEMEQWAAAKPLLLRAEDGIWIGVPAAAQRTKADPNGITWFLIQKQKQN